MARKARSALIGPKPIKIRNVNKKLCNAARRDITMGVKDDNKRRAWMMNKNVVLTIPNPDASKTRERFVRVKAVDVWGRYDHKQRFFMKDKGPTERAVN
jgi:hypothetical protein